MIARYTRTIRNGLMRILSRAIGQNSSQKRLMWVTQKERKYHSNSGAMKKGHVLLLTDVCDQDQCAVTQPQLRLGWSYELLVRWLRLYSMFSSCQAKGRYVRVSKAVDLHSQTNPDSVHLERAALAEDFKNCGTNLALRKPRKQRSVLTLLGLATEASRCERL